MFFHLFVNRLKILVRDKELLFWTLIFPFILATLFNMAFSNLLESEKFEPISIGIVENEEYKKDTTFQKVIEEISQGEDKLFNVDKDSNEEILKEKLFKDEIDAYIVDGKLVVTKEGINQTISKTFLDQYNQKRATMESVIVERQGKIDETTIQNLLEEVNYIKKVSYSKENTDPSMNYFYTLIGMAALYGGFWGIKEIRDIQANQSKRAARVNLAPIHKMKTLGFNLIADVCINVGSIILLLIYLTFGLGADFGNNIAYVVLTCIIGSILGILLGTFIGAVMKKSETTKTSALLTVTMIGSFLAGMMAMDMKYIVMTKAPIVRILKSS